MIAKFDAPGDDLDEDQKHMTDLDEYGHYNDKYLRTTNEKKKSKRTHSNTTKQSSAAVQNDSTKMPVNLKKIIENRKSSKKESRDFSQVTKKG